MAFERESFVADCTFFIFVCTLKSSKIQHFSIFALSLSSDLANFQDIKMILTVFEKELFVSVCVSFHFVYQRIRRYSIFQNFGNTSKKEVAILRDIETNVIRKGIVCTCLYLSYFCLYFKGSEIQRFSIFAKSGSERPT